MCVGGGGGGGSSGGGGGCGEICVVLPCLPGLQPLRGLEREVGRLWAGGYCWDERLLGAGLPGGATLFFEIVPAASVEARGSLDLLV